MDGPDHLRQLYLDRAARTRDQTARFWRRVDRVLASFLALAGFGCVVAIVVVALQRQAYGLLALVPLDLLVILFIMSRLWRQGLFAPASD